MAQQAESDKAVVDETVKPDAESAASDADDCDEEILREAETLLSRLEAFMASGKFSDAIRHFFEENAQHFNKEALDPSKEQPIM